MPKIMLEIMVRTHYIDFFRRSVYDKLVQHNDITRKQGNMSKKPVLENVDDEDIDNMDLDIAQFDPSLKTPIAPLKESAKVTRSQDQEPPLFPMFPNDNKEEAAQEKDILNPNNISDEEKAQLKSFQVIYPCYFDKNRSHKEGRRVSISRAVENPLAKTISDACQRLNMPIVLELDKSHPQDFGNPGRVRIMMKDPERGFKPTDPGYPNKRFLLNSIADYLKAHPTTLESIGPKSGIPVPREYQTDFEPNEIPHVKGFKMNTIVPIHSQFTMKHPMTKSIYEALPEQPKAKNAPKQMKKKIMKIRG